MENLLVLFVYCFQKPLCFTKFKIKKSFLKFYLKNTKIILQEEPKSQKMPPFQMTYEASGLNKEGKYEFWVTASTNIGEGQPSKTVVLTPSLKGNS